MLPLQSIPINYGYSQIYYKEDVNNPKLSIHPISLNNSFSEQDTISLNNSLSEQDTVTADNTNESRDVEKAVILMFDRGYKSQFTEAKPILDKYGFKASFFIICSFIQGSGFHKLDNGSELYHDTSNSDSNGAMSWDEIKQMYEEGHDIESHGNEHRDLRKLSSEQLEREIAESKECLTDKGLKPTYFQFPNNKGNGNSTVLKMVSEYFDFGLADHSKLMFLNCDGWVNHGFKTQSYKYQYDCNPFTADGSPTRTNKYSIREWSHDREHSKMNNDNPSLAPHGTEISDKMFIEFIKVAEGANPYNTKAGKIVAIPIIGYHEISDSSNFDTSIELFDKEMNYLHSNGFKVLKLNDLGYNQTGNYFFIREMQNRDANPQLETTP
jgi:peptidoglycan/xylan/chitin deacetylase (PgdA/CDA1 family)